jgi:hypothetical protein
MKIVCLRVSYKEKYFCILAVGSGSISQRYDTGPRIRICSLHQNVTDPQHCSRVNLEKLELSITSESKNVAPKKPVFLPHGRHTYCAHFTCLYTVIRSVSADAKFGICTVVGLNGTLVKAKIRTFTYPKYTFSFKCPIYRPTTVQMPNLALIETKPQSK